MKNVSSLKNTKTDSPKTPGGISKSLLTPCRRVGLSRNWRKSGPSPFISPLTENAEEQNTNKAKKRKERYEDKEEVGPKESETSEDTENSSQNRLVNKDTITCEKIVTTPIRNISLPRKKKSRISCLNIEKNSELSPTTITCSTTIIDKDHEISTNFTQSEDVQEQVLTRPHKTKSLSRVSVVQDSESSLKGNELGRDVNENKNSTIVTSEHVNSSNKKSPENLTKECIVVIQKKIYKKDLKKLNELQNNHHQNNQTKIVSQVLFDSDSDEVPLSLLNKTTDMPKVVPTDIVCNDDDDFEDVKVVKKLEDKTTSTGGLKSKPDKRHKLKLGKEIKGHKITPHVPYIESKPSSQSSYDDDDDDDFIVDNRKTILVRKTYEKVTKPIKAKSTGSITQKDIDDLKARIEVKKKMLLAKSIGSDTKELRDLIKKWQRGCQDALTELMELMKKQFPDKQNMDYSEILKSLKIPPELVGYDEENDCFNTPSDENIILSKYDL